MDPKAGGEEDDCVDSGAETGGSDYSHMSSTSSELSLEEAQDPFLVSIHIIADPGQSQPLQDAIDKVLAWIHPDLQLFRVSERRACRRRRKAPRGAQPALAVVLFLQEDYGEEQILQLHHALQRPPWRHHHTERVPGRLLPYLPCSQDFFSLAPGTPLWAIRPVHYGQEIVRFTLYCRHDNYTDSLRFYELILRRSPSRGKADFSTFPVFSNMDLDIQFSLKRLPRGQNPVPADSAVLEFRVRDLGELVPLLPNPCSPISEGRWQTEDHDGNRILLQAQRVHRKVPKPGRANHSSEKKLQSTPSPSATIPSQTPSSSEQSLLESAHQGPGQPGLPSGQLQDSAQQASSRSGVPWSFQRRSKSLFCLPTGDSSLAPPTGPHWFSNTRDPGRRAPEWGQSPLFSIDDLEGTQETDVDTGLRLSSSDLSVVSAYSAPSRFCSTTEAPLRSEQCSSLSSKLHTGAKPLTKTSCTALTSKPPSSSSAMPAPPASGTSLLIESSLQLLGDASKAMQMGTDLQPPTVPAEPGDSDMEEFYI
ncbi:protein FAM124A [Erinaceus europaeus]|uniref:Protein FAM124A n=1 Tax=Erinaceus europaeus TaxID=9365 RepID=A0A1S2ZMH8_ERIEU|nr:protein FAM124A [Erinaceus europaeus]